MVADAPRVSSRRSWLRSTRSWSRARSRSWRCPWCRSPGTLLALHVLELHGHRLLPPGIVGWFVRRVDHLALIRPELLNAPSYLRQPSAVTNLLVLAVIALIGPILTALSG